MGASRTSTTSAGKDQLSRRAALRELAGVAVVLAIPIGAAIATAQPIPDPPSRKTLNFPEPPQLSAEQQQREEERERRRASKKQGDGDRSDDSSPRREQRPRATEQGASSS